MNDKIREVALRVAREMWVEGSSERLNTVEFLTRCLQELSTTEQDKLDAAQWRAYQKRKQDLLDRGFLRNPLRDEAIDKAMENGK